MVPARFTAIAKNKVSGAEQLFLMGEFIEKQGVLPTLTGLIIFPCEKCRLTEISGFKV